jgi:hypothetical protein
MGFAEEDTRKQLVWQGNNSKEPSGADKLKDSN